MLTNSLPSCGGPPYWTCKLLFLKMVGILRHAFTGFYVAMKLISHLHLNISRVFALNMYDTLLTKS